MVAKYVKEYHTTSTKSPVGPSTTDLSYESNSIVKTSLSNRKLSQNLKFEQFARNIRTAHPATNSPRSSAVIAEPSATRSNVTA